MADEVEEFVERFVQDGVILTKAQSKYKPLVGNTGTLCILETPEVAANSKKGYVLEWRQNDVTVDSELQDQEWSVVNTVHKRDRTLSGHLPADYHTRLRNVRYNFEEIKSFKVKNNKRELTFYNGSSDELCSFVIQNGNCEYFTGILKSIFKIEATKRDRHMFTISTLYSSEYQQFNKSFAGVNLHDDYDSSYWKILRTIKQNPYETSLNAFAQFSNYFTSLSETAQDSKDSELHPSPTDGDGALSRSPVDYEIVTTQCHLPPRKEFPRCPPLSKEQWQKQFNQQGKIEDVESVKMLIFRGGVQPSIRKQVWKYLLDYYPWDSSEKEREALTNRKLDEYFSMKRQWKSFSKYQEDHFSDYVQRKSLIGKDVLRTDRNIEFYAGDMNTNLETLSDILTTYVMYNFDLGYVQGMSDLLSPILKVMQDECDAFWCFVGFMERIMSNFEEDQASIKKQLFHIQKLLRFVVPDLLIYLEKHQSENMYFCFRWILVWFKREMELEPLQCLWEVLWTGLPCPNFHLLIAVAILEHQKHVFFDNNFGLTEILKYINSLSGAIDMAVMINKAEGIYHQIKEADNVPDTIKLILGLPILEGNDDSCNNDQTHNSSSGSSQPKCSVDEVHISSDELYS